MPESGTYGSVPGAPSNGRPYGDPPGTSKYLGRDVHRRRGARHANADGGQVVATARWRRALGGLGGLQAWRTAIAMASDVN